MQHSGSTTIEFNRIFHALTIPTFGLLSPSFDAQSIHRMLLDKLHTATRFITCSKLKRTSLTPWSRSHQNAAHIDNRLTIYSNELWQQHIVSKLRCSINMYHYRWMDRSSLFGSFRPHLVLETETAFSAQEMRVCREEWHKSKLLVLELDWLRHLLREKRLY